MTTELLVWLVVAAGAVALALLWVVLAHWKRSRRGRRFALLRGLAADSGLSLSGQELTAGGVLGLDTARKVMLVLQFEGARYHWYTLHLAEVASCTVHTRYRALPMAATNIYSINEAIEAVVLQFHFRHGGPPLDVPFYSARHHAVDELPELEARARGWQQFLSKMLQKGHSDRA